MFCYDCDCISTSTSVCPSVGLIETQNTLETEKRIFDNKLLWLAPLSVTFLDASNIKFHRYKLQPKFH